MRISCFGINLIFVTVNILTGMVPPFAGRSEGVSQLVARQDENLEARGGRIRWTKICQSTRRKVKRVDGIAWRHLGAQEGNAMDP